MKFNLFLLLLATLLAVGSSQQDIIHQGDYLIQNIKTNKYWAEPDSADGIPLQTKGAVWRISTVGKNFYISPLSQIHLSLAYLVNDKFLRLGGENTPNLLNLQWKIQPSGSNVAILSAADQKKYVNTGLYNNVEHLSPGSDAKPMWILIPYVAKRTNLP